MKFSQNFIVKLLSASFSISGIKSYFNKKNIKDEIDSEDDEFELSRSHSDNLRNKKPKKVNSQAKIDGRKKRKHKVHESENQDKEIDSDKGQVKFGPYVHENKFFFVPQPYPNDFPRSSSKERNIKSTFEILDFYKTKLIEDCFNVKQMYEFFVIFQNDPDIPKPTWTFDSSYEHILNIATTTAISFLERLVESKFEKSNIMTEFNFEILKYESDDKNDLVFFRKKSSESEIFYNEFPGKFARKYEGKRIYQMLVKNKKNIESNGQSLSDYRKSKRIQNCLFHPNIAMILEITETKDYFFEITQKFFVNFSNFLEITKELQNSEFRRYYSLQFLMAIQYLYKCGLNTRIKSIADLKLYCNYSG
jgi:hypothetical protein